MEARRGVAEPSRRVWAAASAVLVLVLASGVPYAVRAQRKDSASSASVLRVYPGRIIGVYDNETGDPIVGADVRDIATGLHTLTTSTGTLSLFFVDTSGGLIRVTKLGYSPLTLPVANSFSDTIPLVIMMTQMGHVLPAVVVSAQGNHMPRGPADTVQRLEAVGFYDRQLTTGAPPAAFVTAEKLEGMTTLEDLARNLAMATGRGICTDNLYVDGIRVSVPSRSPEPGRVSRTTKGPVDMIVPIEDVVGVEMYDVSDIPEQYNVTQANGRSASCATLIWTKRRVSGGESSRQDPGPTAGEAP